jgi:hypothetical protein
MEGHSVQARNCATCLARWLWFFVSDGTAEKYSVGGAAQKEI